LLGVTGEVLLKVEEPFLDTGESFGASDIGGDETLQCAVSEYLVMENDMTFKKLTSDYQRSSLMQMSCWCHLCIVNVQGINTVTVQAC
jgi:hypothetical protein